MGLAEAVEEEQVNIEAKALQAKQEISEGLDYIPFRAPENVQRRHSLIVALRRKGHSLRRCAKLVGLSYKGSARYHVNGHCKCNLRKGAREWPASVT